MILSNDLKDNYEQLRVERGWSYDQLADHVATTDVRLAGYFRSQDGQAALAERTPPALAQADLDALAADAAANGDSQFEGTVEDVDDLAEAFASIGAPLTEQQLAVLKSRAVDTLDEPAGVTIEAERAAGEARQAELQPTVEPGLAPDDPGPSDVGATDASLPESTVAQAEAAPAEAAPAPAAEQSTAQKRAASRGKVAGKN